ncbi:hypothetical protein BELL_0060g00070 [Botrytis elliptica]|uniref:Uncharacterized protein n=1 Tax=Botrytis elliptica TaxID=278938 RepID=A0A4Z1KBQ0_9HELO|nr:hypothetical protein EAE99_001270 [Botrytis elliptica]TGO78613.1 hypothetical protein BELL_0060g00070 [Botrytis elliptica]
MSGHDPKDISSKGKPRGGFEAIKRSRKRAPTITGVSSPPVPLVDPQPQVPLIDFQGLPGGDQFPGYHPNNGAYTVNPQIPVHHHVDGTLINHDQVPQWSLNSNQHQAQDPSYTFGQQQTQIQGNYPSNIDHGIDQQPFIDLPFPVPPIEMDQRFSTPVYATHSNGHEISQQIPAQFQHGEAPAHCNQQPQMPINQNDFNGVNNKQQEYIDFSFQIDPIDLERLFQMRFDDNGHNISQQIPAQSQLEEAPAYCGQQHQMPVNQTNFNGVNNNQQAYQRMDTTAASSFANLSAQEQEAEFQHFVQQRLALGDTQMIQFKIFQAWYIGRQLNGIITPTLAYGVIPLHPALSFNNNVPIQQPMMPLNNQGYMQPPNMIYQNTGEELTTGFQHTMGPSTTFNGQAMQPNNEQHLQNPQKSIKPDTQTRRTSLAVVSGGQSILPGSSRSMARPVLSITTTMPAPSSSTRAQASSSTTRPQAPPLTTTMPAHSSTTRVQAPPLTTTMPAASSSTRVQAHPLTTTMPAHSSTTRVQAHPLTTTMPAASSSTRAQASSSITRPQAHQLTTTMTRAQAPPSNTALPAVTRRNRKQQIGHPEQMGNKTCATGKKTSREQETEVTPANQPMYISINRILGAAPGKYTVSFSKLPEVGSYADDFDNHIYHYFDAEIEALDAKKAESEKVKVYMLRNEESLAMLRTVLGEMLQQFIALSLDTSSDARQSLENYAKTKQIRHSSMKSLEFAPKSQFTEEKVKVARETEQTAQSTKDDVPACATHNLMCATNESDLNGTTVEGSWSLFTKTTFIDESTPLKYAIGLEIEVAKIGDRYARDNLLIYERSLPSNIAGEPLWADVLDLLKLQAAEWGLTASIQDPPTPEPRTVRGEKRKRQQQPELHASPAILASSSEASNSSSDQGNSPTSNTSTDRTSVSPKPVVGAPRLSDNSRPIKRSRNGYEMGLLEAGTGMRKSSPLGVQARLPSSMQPPMGRISQNDHMHPARSPSEIVRSPSTTETQNRMPVQVRAEADESSFDAPITFYRQGVLLVNNERPYQYPISELIQPSRTFSAQSNMPPPVQIRLSRQPTEVELAPCEDFVNSRWVRSFPAEKKSS